MVPVGAVLTIQLLDVLHCPWAIVGWNRSRLSDGMDVPHVVNGRGWVGVECLNVRVHVLGRRELLRHDMLLEGKRVVGTG